ncbi:MAG: HEPN domain-containing protein [Deltaproteobacteria bacterium]|nr:HEPN domain-containing protein [Deltaproteobacteria bacterium]
MNAKNRKLNASAEWKKSTSALLEAKLLLNEGFVEASISRSYYAAFHAAQTLLLTEGLETRSHQGVGKLFSLHFIKSGKMLPKFSRILSNAQKHREEADYSSEYVFTKEDAENELTAAQDFVATAEAYLKEHHYL